MGQPGSRTGMQQRCKLPRAVATDGQPASDGGGSSSTALVDDSVEVEVDNDVDIANLAAVSSDSDDTDDTDDDSITGLTSSSDDDADYEDDADGDVGKFALHAHATPTASSASSPTLANNAANTASRANRGGDDWAAPADKPGAVHPKKTRVGGGGGRYYIEPVTKSMRCYNCEKTGHMSRDCPNPRKMAPCHLCGDVGHLSRNCPDELCFNCWSPGQ